MSRLKTIYSNQVLLVGPSPATGANTTGNIKKLHRVQSIGNSLNYALENINEYGILAAIDRVNLDGSENRLDFSYFMVDFENEANLGFVVDSTVGAMSDILTRESDDRNYYRFIAPEGIDADGLAPTSGAVFAVGNGFLSSYSAEFAVGSFPTVTISVDGLNSASYLDGAGQDTPAVDPTTGRKAAGTFTLPTIPFASPGKPSVIRPGDVKVEFSNPDAGIFQTLDATDLNIQNVSFSFDLNLNNISALGSRMPRAKDLTFPVNVTVNIEALMSDIAEANVVDLLCEEQPTDITIKLYNSDCDDGGPTLDEIYAQIIIKNCNLTSEDLTGTLGPNDTARMQFITQIGSANDSNNGVFFSGVIGYTSSGTPVFSD